MVNVAQRTSLRNIGHTNCDIVVQIYKYVFLKWRILDSRLYRYTANHIRGHGKARNFVGGELVMFCKTVTHARAMVVPQDFHLEFLIHYDRQEDTKLVLHRFPLCLVEYIVIFGVGVPVYNSIHVK